MGSVRVTPITRATAVSAHAQLIDPLTASKTAEPRAAAASRESNTIWPGNVTDWPLRTPCSLPKATKLPEKVTAPIKTEIPIVIRVRRSESGSVANADSATRADAPPPNPLKAATSWGMAVISTFLARNAPMPPPKTRPANTAV